MIYSKYPISIITSWNLEALIPFACSDEFRPQLGMDGALGRLNHLKSIKQSCKTWGIMTFADMLWHFKVIYYDIFAICFFFAISISVFFVAKDASFFHESHKCSMSILEFFLQIWERVGCCQLCHRYLLSLHVLGSVAAAATGDLLTPKLAGCLAKRWWQTKMNIITCIVFHRNFCKAFLKFKGVNDFDVASDRTKGGGSNFLLCAVCPC